MKALEIKFDAKTGKRAGDVDPKDENLNAKGSAWQYLNDENPSESCEIRLIEDNRDASQYRDIDGVEVLENKKQIQSALDVLDSKKPDKYRVDKEVIIAALQDPQHPEWGDLTRVIGVELQTIAEDLYKDGVPGVEKVKREKPRI